MKRTFQPSGGDGGEGFTVKHHPAGGSAGLIEVGEGYGLPVVGGVCVAAVVGESDVHLGLGDDLNLPVGQESYGGIARGAGFIHAVFHHHAQGDLDTVEIVRIHGGHHIVSLTLGVSNAGGEG